VSDGCQAALLGSDPSLTGFVTWSSPLPTLSLFSYFQIQVLATSVLPNSFTTKNVFY
jgi:hypothetical protein